ncbi:hypothetical protein D3C78_1807370 [compost metagenome]
MLDLMIDYAQLAPRIIEGALADVLGRRQALLQEAAATAPAAATDNSQVENA